MAESAGRVLKVGIIGQGRSGYSIHAAHFRQDPKYQIAAIADPLEDRLAHAAETFGCAVYTDWRDMLTAGGLDLVVNATPSHLHVPVTLEIIRRGFNVVCEKPLARRAAEVDQLIWAAKEAGVVFTIYQQSRYAPYFRKVREVIDSGVLGRAVLIKVAFNGFSRRWDWQTLQEMNGGNLLNTGPHPLDQALQLFGPGMPRVHCLMDRANVAGDAEDFVKLILSGPGHPTIDLEISSCDAWPLYTYHVDGTQGGLTGTMKELKWRWFVPAENPMQPLIREPLPKQAYCSESLTWHEDSWTVPPANNDLFATMSGAYYGDLYQTLTAGAPLVIDPAQVRRQIEVIEECHRQNPLSRLGE
ncbi:MAG: Gfo/Idh/MocA family oxidoreductase [Fimbriimonadaceae bacterium]|nr:Gfo/Idh/MocA family oxidoreductase [Fimbriimonadaceae bacterium]